MSEYAEGLREVIRDKNAQLADLRAKHQELREAAQKVCDLHLANYPNRPPKNDKEMALLILNDELNTLAALDHTKQGGER